MTILSNDYLSSVPGSGYNVKGGPARFAVDFSGFALSRGHEWIGLVHQPEDGGRLYSELPSLPGKRFFAVHSQAATLEGLRALTEPCALGEFVPKEVAELQRLIVALRPDVLFLNGFSAYAWMLFAAAAQAGVPTVIQHAGIFTREVDEYRDLFTESGRELCHAMERDAAQRTTSNVFLNASSKAAFEQLVGLGGAEGSRIIPLPHTGWPFREGAFGPTLSSTRTLGAVARWDRIKNHDALLSLAESVTAKQLPWRLQSVTRIPETPAKADMKARYRELITVVPPMDHAALRSFYGSLDVLLVPSHFDVSPTVVMEGIACGLPALIAPQVGWVSAYEACGMEEWIVDFGDPERVIERLQKLFARGAWPEVQGLAEFVKKWHNPEIVFQSYLDLFTDLLRT